MAFADVPTPPAASSPPPPPVTTLPYPIRLQADYPEHLNRWLVLIKWLLVFPHSIVLMFLGLGQFAAGFCAWWAILFTGHYPRSLFNFVVAVETWRVRASAYSALLITDEYPPFEFDRPVGGIGVAMIILGVAFILAIFAAYTAFIIAMVAASAPRGTYY